MLLRSTHGSRAAQQSNGAPHRLLQIATLAIALLFAVIWLLIAAVRFRYPYELEWCGGTMRETMQRVLAGLPIYVAPGAGWIPYEYPPLYFWAGALVAKLSGLGGFMPLRLVSIASTIGSALILYLWTSRLVPEERHKGRMSGAGVWPYLAAGLFIASYRFVGAWFDIERLDMLFLFLSLLGIYLAELTGGTESAMLAAAAGLVLALSFFTKQQAILFAFGCFAALGYRRRWKQLVIMAAAFSSAAVAGIYALNHATTGWFAYYCFRVPLANGTEISLARQFLLQDMPLYAPAIAIIAGCAMLIRRRGASSADLSVMICTTAAGLLGSLVSRAHWGGDENVVMTAYVFTGALACVSAARSQAMFPTSASPLYALALAQFVVLVYRPTAQLPTAAGYAAGQRFTELIRALEQGGDIYCVDHGGFTGTPHGHFMALHDVENADKRWPPDLLNAIRMHRFAAVVVDAKPTKNGLGALLLDSYPSVRCEEIGKSWCVTGYLTPDPSRRVWVMRP